MQSSAYLLLVVAYLIVWLAIFFYVVRLNFEQRRLSRRLETLQSKFSNANDDSAGNSFVAPPTR
jgi:CcmD family protein